VGGEQAPARGRDRNEEEEPDVDARARHGTEEKTDQATHRERTHDGYVEYQVDDDEQPQRREQPAGQPLQRGELVDGQNAAVRRPST
jgi:hypothetical protein